VTFVFNADCSVTTTFLNPDGTPGDTLTIDGGFTFCVFQRIYFGYTDPTYSRNESMTVRPDRFQRAFPTKHIEFFPTKFRGGISRRQPEPLTATTWGRCGRCKNVRVERWGLATWRGRHRMDRSMGADGNPFSFDGMAIRYWVKFSCLPPPGPERDKVQLEFTYRVWQIGCSDERMGRTSKRRKA